MDYYERARVAVTAVMGVALLAGVGAGLAADSDKLTYGCGVALVPWLVFIGLDVLRDRLSR